MIHEIQAKTLLSSHSRPDPWFGCQHTMNIYRGCSHQCIYCDSRSDCYQIENFADTLVKVNAIENLRDTLSRKRKKGTICTGSMSDSYTSAEEKYGLTQKALDVIAEFEFPLHLMTKSKKVLRDIAMLKRISKVYCAVTFTITTVDDDLARKIEPGASLPSERLAAMRHLNDEGIYTGVAMMPVLPLIADGEDQVRASLGAFAKNSARYIMPFFGLTMRDGQREYFYKKLDEHFPGMSKKYRQMYGEKYSCPSPNSKKLYEIAKEWSKREGIPLGMKFYEEEQGRLFRLC